jgi:hypothetical protein
MRKLYAAALLFVVCASGGGASQNAGAGNAYPDAGAFFHKVREATRLDYELQSNFSYLEERREVRISKLGKVEVGPQRTFEVFPSSTPGRTYKRLIAVNGVPLSAEELAKRDREHRNNLETLRAQQARETPAERKKRLETEAEELAQRNAILDDALAVFQGKFIGRETIDGANVFVLSITPREAARVRTREGRWLKSFAGTVWITADDYQIAKLDMRAQDDVSIGWGILGRVHEGSRFVFARRRFEGAWLPSQVVFDATGRTLLFRKFDLDLVTTYSGYKRVGQ